MKAWLARVLETEFTRDTFDTLARRGASQIASAGTTDLFGAWLEAIRNEQINFRYSQHMPAVEVKEDGSKGQQYMSGSISNPCEASAILCKKLETRAIQSEFEEKQRHHPRNWSRLRTQFEIFKMEERSKREPPEEIPLALVKKVIAEERGINPEEVTVQQIRLALSELWVDYPTITVNPDPESEHASVPSPTATQDEDEVERRKRLLEEYKSTTGCKSNKRIYEARNSGIHKPQFYRWVKGTLPVDSATTVTFERFLRDKKLPIPRKPKG
jgi:hypothetical protein